MLRGLAEDSGGHGRQQPQAELGESIPGRGYTMHQVREKKGWHCLECGEVGAGMRRIWGAGQRELRMGPHKPWEEVWTSSQYKAKPLTGFRQERSMLRVVT